MLVRKDSLTDKLILHLPLCIGAYEHARVGEDTETFRRFTPILRFAWGWRSTNAIDDDNPTWCFYCNSLLEVGEQSVETYVDMSDPESGPSENDLYEVIVHKKCFKAFLGRRLPEEAF